MSLLVLYQDTVMNTKLVRRILVDEIRFYDAEILGWTSMQDYFGSLDDSFRHDNQAVVAGIEDRLSLLRQRREQLLHLIKQMEESLNVSGMV